MVAWHGNADLKRQALEQLRLHQRSDEIVQGSYWDGHKGCLLGCLTHQSTGTHAAAAQMFGIPARVSYWIEAVFEGLLLHEARQWVIDSTEAIPVAGDLSLANHHLAVWLLGPDSPSAVGNCHPSVCDAISAVRILHERAALGESVSESEWSAARSAAESAWSAARSAAWSARSAARSAAESAAESVWSAARSAAWSAWSAAAWSAIAAESLRIFRGCK